MRNKARLSPLTMFSSNTLEVLANAIIQENKKHTDWEEEIKLSFFADDITVYVEILTELRKNTPGIISDYSKVAGHTKVIQTYKSQLLSYILAMTK